MMLLPCPYLHGAAELSAERERHIQTEHPDLLPEHAARLAETLAAPDEVRNSWHASNARLFSRWFPDLRNGKHVVVVVFSEDSLEERHWIVTAYLARRLSGGIVEWARG